MGYRRESCRGHNYYSPGNRFTSDRFSAGRSRSRAGRRSCVGRDRGFRTDRRSASRSFSRNYSRPR